MFKENLFLYSHVCIICYTFKQCVTTVTSCILLPVCLKRLYVFFNTTKLSHPCLSNITRSSKFYNQLLKCSIIYFLSPGITISSPLPDVYSVTSYRIQIILRIFRMEKYILNMAPPMNTKNILFVFVIILTNCKMKIHSS